MSLQGHFSLFDNSMLLNLEKVMRDIAPGGPWQSGELGHQEHNEVQDKKMPNPNLWEEQPLVHPGGRLPRKQIFREGSGNAGGKNNHEPEKCFCSRQGQQHPGMHWEHCQQVRRAEHLALLSTSENTSGVLCPVPDSSVVRDMDAQELMQWRPAKMVRISVKCCKNS